VRRKSDKNVHVERSLRQVSVSESERTVGKTIPVHTAKHHFHEISVVRKPSVPSRSALQVRSPAPILVSGRFRRLGLRNPKSCLDSREIIACEYDAIFTQARCTVHVGYHVAK